MAAYRRLTETEREEISRQRATGRSRRAIAESLGRAPSTITRELTRNVATPESYRATAARARAAARACTPRRARRFDTDVRLRDYVFKHLRRRWSPEQIAHRLVVEYPQDATMWISHETIYTYLYVLPRGTLRKELLKCLWQPRPRPRSPERRGKIPDMISIEERPAEFADRSVPGHWESDLSMGSRNASALGTLVERTSRTVLLVPLEGKTAPEARGALGREITTLPAALRRSLTYDQGKEMSEHRLFTEQTEVQVYFAHPHSPWERGTSENTNGLLRPFFPKGTDFRKVSPAAIQRVQDLTNGRPRKTLEYRTPAEVFSECLLNC